MGGLAPLAPNKLRPWPPLYKYTSSLVLHFTDQSYANG